MKELLDEAMRDGAIGLSTMLASPRELAVTTDDLVDLCQVVKKHGGLFSSHIRNEGVDVFDAVKEAIAVGTACPSAGRYHPSQDRRSVALGAGCARSRPWSTTPGARVSMSRRMCIPTPGATTISSASSPLGT